MNESSWALRIALFAVSVVVIAGIYLFGVWRRRQRNREFSGRIGGWPGSPRSPVFDDDTGDGLGDEIIAVRVRKVEATTDLPADLPMVKNDVVNVAPPPPLEEPVAPAPAKQASRKRTRRTTAQLDFGFADANPAPRSPPPEPTLLTLYLRPHLGPAFVGSQIVRNLNAVGMRHGDRQIFHHFGAGDLRTDTALFSLADMFEPGYFDLQRIEAYQTQGLVMFLNLPTALDGPVAFELFLNTAQRLAEGLQADLLVDPSTPLDNASIDKMRRTAGRYTQHGV